MQQDYRKLARDMYRRASEVERVVRRDVPAYLAVAWEKMKDANFSAQGFVRNGSASPRWEKRKQETARTAGKRILHSTGTLQNSVRFAPGASLVRAWVDLGKVPYARIHNEGGRASQYVRPFTRTIRGRRQQVGGFFRRATYPRRQYLGVAPDIFKIAHKDIADAIRRALK